MGAITRAFANNILTSGNFDASALSGDLPAISGASLTGAVGGLTKLLSAGSGVDTANLVFDNLDVTTYCEFYLMLFSRPEGDDKHLYMQMRDSSGNNITTSQYNSAGVGISSSTFSGNYSWHENSQDHFRVHNNAGNATNELHGTRLWFTPRKSTMEDRHGNCYMAQGFRFDASSNFRHETSTGQFNDGGPPSPEGFRIYYQTNNISAYDYKLYGVKE